MLFNIAHPNLHHYECIIGLEIYTDAQLPVQLWLQTEREPIHLGHLYETLNAFGD